MLKPSFFKLKKSNSNDCPVGNRINDEDKSTHSQTSVDEGYLKPVENTHNTKKKIKLDDGSSSGSSKTIINKLSVFSYQNSGNYKHEVRTDFRNVSSAAASYVRKEFSDRKKDIDEEGRNLSVITPLETQIMELKQQYYDMILLIQNAYKYTFFGEDAVIASQVLHITLSHAFNIPMAIVPTIRLHVHLQRLVDEGYTIGVVNEVESLGLKSGGDNKKDIYERHLLHVFSKASLRGQDVSSVFTNTSVIWGGTSANYIMCLTESCTSDGIPTIGFTAFDPTTCDMVCDVFIDDYRRNGIDKRLEHLKPSEVIVSDNISLNTLQLILHSYHV